ncbi:MAG: type II toxin-antitoxin system HicB family antitoxin [Candidatus Methylomirabilales bacterium]
MKRTFTASVWREGDWFVAQCLEVDVASQGESERQALANLREALELYFEEPRAQTAANLHRIEVEVSAA